MKWSKEMFNFTFNKDSPSVIYKHMLFIAYLSLHNDSCQSVVPENIQSSPSPHGGKWKFKGDEDQKGGVGVGVAFSGAPCKIGVI